MKYLLFLPVSIFLITFTSCKKDKVQGCSADCTDTISFNTTILPLMQENCMGCHDVGNAGGGYVISNFENISANADVILNAMRGEGGIKQMPQDLPALHDTLIQKFECWSCQGKLNN